MLCVRVCVHVRVCVISVAGETACWPRASIPAYRPHRGGEGEVGRESRAERGQV